MHCLPSFTASNRNELDLITLLNDKIEAEKRRLHLITTRGMIVSLRLRLHEQRNNNAQTYRKYPLERHARVVAIRVVRSNGNETNCVRASTASAVSSKPINRCILCIFYVRLMLFIYIRAMFTHSNVYSVHDRRSTTDSAKWLNNTIFVPPTPHIISDSSNWIAWHLPKYMFHRHGSSITCFFYIKHKLNGRWTL